MLPMVAFILWLVIALALGFAETVTVGISLMPFAGGALLAGVVIAFGVGFLVQAICFLVGSLVLALVLGIRRGNPDDAGPSAMGWAPPVADAPTSVYATQEPAVDSELVGQVAVVARPIMGNDEGAVHLDGDVWTARALETGATFGIGALVSVREIRGETVVVTAM